ncbi:MAG: hypothetical protein ACSHX0_00495 [Akkermansiaceae bacterium]
MNKSSSSAPVNTARIIYLLICELAGAAIANHAGGADAIWIGMLIGLVVAAFFILVESLTKKFTLRGFSHATFGLLIGIFCAWLLSRGLVNLLEITLTDTFMYLDSVLLSVHVVIYSTLGFLGAVLAIRSSKDDFALLIPYVRFRGEATSGMPIVLDDLALTDERLPRLLSAGFIDGRLIVPRFIIEELHILANSPTDENHEKSKVGLRNLENIQSSHTLKISIHDSEFENPADSHDTKLILSSQMLGAKLLTTDDSLAKSARLQGLTALNLNDLTTALKPQISIGDRIQLELVRVGKNKTQAIGYRSDGSMIVVNHAADKINTTQEVVIISMLDTDSGTLIFAELVKNG